MIKTKLHRIREIIDSNSGVVKTKERSLILERMEAANKYFVDRDVVELMNREDVQLSIAAMIDAGVARLPFNPLLIEYATISKDDHPIHCCVLLTEQDDSIGAEVILVYNNGSGELVRSSFEGARVKTTFVHEKGKAGLRVDANNAGDTLDAEITALAVMMALLMLWRTHDARSHAPRTCSTSGMRRGDAGPQVDLYPASPCQLSRGRRSKDTPN